LPVDPGPFKEKLMRKWQRNSVIAGAAVVLAAVSLSVRRGEGQSQRPARLDGHPNLSGIWQALNEANWDLEGHAARAGMVTQPGVMPLATVPAAPVLALGAVGSVPGSVGVVEGGKIPYRPEMAARKKENQEHWLERDPETKCYVAGIPRSMYLPYPFQIFQGRNKIEVSFEYSSTGQTINMDKVEKYPADTANGFSEGRWEGDTLVVEVTGFDDKSWFDRAGNFHSDAMKLVERFTPIGSVNDMIAMQFEATIDDPKTFTRPWKIRMPLYRRLEPNAQLIEFRCQEFVEELMFGHLRKQQLVKHWESPTMNIDITRKVPSDQNILYSR
jgi:hypothetical protein